MFFRKKELLQVGLHDIGEPELEYWNMLEVENEDVGNLVIRLRKSKPPIPDIDEYSTCVEIKWDYSDRSKGMPDEETSNLYNQFEAAVDDLFWYNNLSFNVRITTGLGERVWVCYTKSYEEFIKHLNNKLESLPNFPLAISYLDDSEWSIWKESLEDYVDD
ncbi:MAG: DUF695 domain-containing protein [Candidatus Thiodiazotropha lotti]|nr:DUF695 domain-containing protein [Candidatus Thiodiazotropha lotti]